MCKAKDYTEQLLNIYQSIENDFNILSNRLSQIDIEEQKVLHKIEESNFNAYQGYLFAKELKEVRAERRRIKNEVLPLMKLRNDFIQNNTKQLESTHTSIIKQENNAINFKPYNPKLKLVSTEQNNNKEKNQNQDEGMRLKKSNKKSYRLDSIGQRYVLC
ncbi:MAG: hypothetical protein M0P99_08710 [Candidatus Cloacimonetes bacterium]|nr:hypothetical protein [Candidatus Cloacimonadota bacterium]